MSKREKKELKKAEKAAKAAEKMNGDKDKDEGVAEKLYTGKNFALFEREKLRLKFDGNFASIIHTNN